MRLSARASAAADRILARDESVAAARELERALLDDHLGEELFDALLGALSLYAPGEGQLYSGPEELRRVITEARATELAPVEYEDRWVVPLDGVPYTWFDYAVTLNFTYRAQVVVRIESGLTYRTAAGAEHVLDPGGEPTLLAPLLAIIRVDGREMVAWRSGALDISFVDGSTIRVEPGEQYESWQLHGPHDFMLTSGSSGSGLTTFQRVT